MIVLAVSKNQLYLGINKLRKMVNMANSKVDIMKIYPYYLLLLAHKDDRVICLAQSIFFTKYNSISFKEMV